MFSWRHTLVNICPRLDAAAVCTSAVCPSRRIVPTMPSTVSGFTKHEAPCAGVMPAGSTRQCAALMARNWAYIAPPKRATVLGSDIHVMLALRRRSRQVVVTNKQFNGPDMVGELLGKGQRVAH